MHAYDPQTKEPHHWVKTKDGTKDRPTTTRDMVKNGWVPGVTTVLDVLRKPALEKWMLRQGVMAVVTAPDVPGEDLDAKISRILEVEAQQDEEARIARDRGTELHAALEAMFTGHVCPPDLLPWVEPCAAEVRKLGFMVGAEQIITGNGYGGKVDLTMDRSGQRVVIDFKTAGTLPKTGSWPEHRLQLAAYAAAMGDSALVGNAYISTKEQGKFVLFTWSDWQNDYAAFQHLLAYWQHAHGWKPNGDKLPF